MTTVVIPIAAVGLAIVGFLVYVNVREWRSDFNDRARQHEARRTAQEARDEIERDLYMQRVAREGLAGMSRAMGQALKGMQGLSDALAADIEKRHPH